MSELIPLDLIPPGINDQRSRDFVGALDRLLSRFSTSAILVQDPMTVDRMLLPSMVVSLAMTDFMPAGLNETATRRLLAAAPEIHKWTGTVKGARMALQAIGVKVVWQQWYQKKPVKGPHDTHVVTAYVNEQLFDDDTNLLSTRVQKAILRQLEATQRWSQDIDFQIGVGVASGVQAATVLQAMQVGQYGTKATTPRRGTSLSAFASAAQAMQIGLVEASAATPRRGRARATAAVGAQAMQVSVFGGIARHRSMR